MSLQHKHTYEHRYTNTHTYTYIFIYIHVYIYIHIASGVYLASGGQDGTIQVCDCSIHTYMHISMSLQHKHTYEHRYTHIHTYIQHRAFISLLAGKTAQYVCGRSLLDVVCARGMSRNRSRALFGIRITS